MLERAVYPPVQATPMATQTPEAPPQPGFSLADGDGKPAEAVTPAPEPTTAAGPGLFAADGWVGQQLAGIRDLAFPGELNLAQWLQGRTGTALLVQLDPVTPDDIWLIAGPDITMADLAVQVDRFRRSGHHAERQQGGQDQQVAGQDQGATADPGGDGRHQEQEQRPAQGGGEPHPQAAQQQQQGNATGEAGDPPGHDDVAGHAREVLEQLEAREAA
jgi:hypothetical protein